MRKALNRERTNVGRTTYTSRVKSILKAAKSDVILSELAEQIKTRDLEFSAMKFAGERLLKLASQHLRSEMTRSFYVTTDDMLNNPDYLGDIQRDGYTIVTVSDSIVNELQMKMSTHSVIMSWIFRYLLSLLS